MKLDQLAQGYLSINPSGQVPTLVVDGQPIVESSIINEFINETHPEPPLLPSDPVTRAHIRAWTKYVDSGPTVKIATPTYRAWVGPAVSGLPQAQLLSQVSQAPDEVTRERWQRTVLGQITDQDVEDAYRALEELLRRMEKQLETREWLFGDAYSLADLETTPILVRLEQLGRGDLIAKYPRAAAWFARVKALPNFQPTYAFLTQQ